MVHLQPIIYLVVQITMPVIIVKMQHPMMAVAVNMTVKEYVEEMQ